MNFPIKGLPLFVTVTALSGIFVLLNYVKLSAVVGVSSTYFSLASIVFPLSGLLGFSGIAIVTFARLIMAIALYGTPLSATVYYIPTIFASAYWVLHRRVFPVIVSCVCIILFVVHPVGFNAAIYSFYWFIPVVVAFMPSRFIFTQALSSTFLAHAVGSVIFLYMHPAVPATQWISLIPLVAVERCIFALGMTGVYYAGMYINYLVLEKIKNIFQKQALS
jgi:hypothetical protein